MRAGSPATGPVKPPRGGTAATGSSTPTERASSGDQTPAAQTTVPVSIVPERGLDAADLRVLVPDCRDRAAREDRGAVARAPAAYPCTTASGLAWPSSGQYVAARTPSSPAIGDSSPHLVEIDEPARHAELVLQRDARLEARDVLLAVEQEQVADLVEVDLRARALAEARERLDAAQADRDVERVGELRAEAARGAARRSARELVALEEADVDARLGEMERDARADHAASDDDDVGGRGQRRSPAHEVAEEEPDVGRDARRGGA